MFVIILKLKSLKLAFKTGFLVQNINLYLCGQVENTKWILGSRKIVVKCGSLCMNIIKAPKI